jgi:hypothetical protein
LIPDLGTVAIIAFAARDVGVGRVLSLRPIVGIGLISYSAYLWHQPILAFARLSGFEDGSTPRLLLLVVAAFPLSYLSWRFVEQPFRRKDVLTRRSVLALSAAVLAAFCLVGGVIHRQHGFADRSVFKDNAKVNEYLAVKAQIRAWSHWCEQHRIKSPFALPICEIGEDHAEPEPELILWGDSFAGALMPGLDAELKGIGHSSLVFEADGCPPVPGVSIVGGTQCPSDPHGAFVKYVGGLPQIKHVICYGNVQGAMMNSEIRLNGVATSVDSASAVVRNTVEQLKQLGKEVIFVEQGPFMPSDTPDFYARNELSHRQDELFVPREQYLKFVEPIQRLQTSIAASGQFLATEDFFCDQARCPARTAQYGLVYSDNVHVSLVVARALARSILSRVRFH